MKAECKQAAKSAGENLRRIFNDVTLRDVRERSITFTKCESVMYRARRQLHPKMPETSFQSETSLPGTPYALYLKGVITVGKSSFHFIF